MIQERCDTRACRRWAATRGTRALPSPAPARRLRRHRLREHCTVHTMTRKTGTVSIKPLFRGAVQEATRSLGRRDERHRTGEAKPTRPGRGCGGASVAPVPHGSLERTTARPPPGPRQRTIPRREAVRPTSEIEFCHSSRRDARHGRASCPRVRHRCHIDVSAAAAWPKPRPPSASGRAAET